MGNDQYQKLRDYALKLLSFRPRSSKEIKNRLMQFSIKRGISVKLVEKVIEELISQNFINDGEFTAWWIEQRQTFKPKGRRALQMELLEKGINKEVIDEALTKEAGEDKEFELALKVVSKKIAHLKYSSAENLKIKISGLLGRRGFSWDTIYKVIDSLRKKS